MQKIAISIGDLNGIGIQLAIQNHKKISKICKPIYCISYELLVQSAKLLKTKIPDNFTIYGAYKYFKIKPGKIDKSSGYFSYQSFQTAISLAKDKIVDKICTLPINKKAWEISGIKYVGHTDMLRNIFNKNAIMMLGCKKMYIALYTEHIPLKMVHKQIQKKKLIRFLIDLHKSLKTNKQIGVLGLNPHAGDGGILGKEEKVILKAIKKANYILKEQIFSSVLIPDVAFTKSNRKKFTHYVAMYHDQGLIPLKTLYFDESINISLNLPIIRTSVDHGTAFDIAYKKTNNINSNSYINAIRAYC